MSFTVLLNSSNVVGSNNNTYQYKFTNGSFKIPEGYEMAISQATIPYSWYNITSRYNNRTFTFRWANNASTIAFTMPDGFYSVADINAYLQQKCIDNGWYLIDSAGNNVYYLVISTNTNYYKVQILTMLVPSSLPAGYTAPSNFAGYPTVPTSPSIMFSATGSIGPLLGYSPGSYGYALEAIASLSNTVPKKNTSE